jgi:hypothetical protein
VIILDIIPLFCRKWFSVVLFKFIIIIIIIIIIAFDNAGWLTINFLEGKGRWSKEKGPRSHTLPFR